MISLSSGSACIAVVCSSVHPLVPYDDALRDDEFLRVLSWVFGIQSLTVFEIKMPLALIVRHTPEVQAHHSFFLITERKDDAMFAKGFVGWFTKATHHTQLQQ